MAGTVYGKLECFSNPGSATPRYLTSQEIFKGLYDFMVYLESQNIVTLRARFAGVGATAASTDYWDGANPFTANAWFLYEWRTATTTPANPSYAGTRTFPWYLLVQFGRADQATTITGNAAPATYSGLATLSSNDCFVGFSSAIGAGGDFQAWNGTLGTFGNPSSFGNQAKGTPVWKVPGSGGVDVFVFPRSNNPGGTHATNRQNLTELYYQSSAVTQCRFSFMADHDSILGLVDESNNGNYQFVYMGEYTPRSGLNPAYPFVHLSSSLPITSGAQIGVTTGIGLNQMGVIYDSGLTVNRGVKLGMVGRVDEVFTATVQPSTLTGSNVYDEMQLTMGVNEFFQGYMGDISFFREVYNTTNLETNTAGSKLIVGTPTVASIKIVVPWKTGLTPGSGATRDGTTSALP